jgi:hypothetical protein
VSAMVLAPGEIRARIAAGQIAVHPDDGWIWSGRRLTVTVAPSATMWCP